MVTNYEYVNIRRVLEEVHRHPLLSDVSLEQAISYVITFIGLFGCPNMFRDEETEIHIEDYRGLLPCSLVSINQVKDCRTKICLRSMTDTFKMDENREMTFKTQGRVLYTSFRQGDVLVSYKAIPIDDDGFPLLIDNPVFLKCLEAYIKKEVFTILFDMNKISNAVLQNAQQSYAWLAGQCQSEFNIPSVSEMQSITNMWTSLIQKNNHFYNGFRDLGESNNLRIH